MYFGRGKVGDGGEWYVAAKIVIKFKGAYDNRKIGDPWST